MSRFGNTVRVIPEPNGSGVFGVGTHITPMIEVKNYHRWAIQWRQEAAVGVITAWRWYATCVALDSAVGAVDNAEAPLPPEGFGARPDVWDLRPEIAFATLPSAALGTDIYTSTDTVYTAIIGAFDVSVPTEQLSLWLSALGS